MIRVGLGDPESTNLAVQPGCLMGNKQEDAVEELQELVRVVEKTQSTAEEIERAIASLDNLFTQNEDVLDDKTRVEMIDLRTKLVSKKLQIADQATSVAQNRKVKSKRRRVIPINKGESGARKRQGKAEVPRQNRARTPEADNTIIAVLGAGVIIGLLVFFGSGD